MRTLGVRPAWNDNHTWDRFLAFAWEDEAARNLLVTINLPLPKASYVILPFVDLSGKKKLFSKT